MRPRKKDKHLPPCVFHHHGAYFLVKRGKWERLGADLATALAEYGRRHDVPRGTMPSLIDEALASVKGSLALNTWKQYQVAANKLKPILAEFAPEQVKSKHVAQIKLSMADTPNMANRCLSVLRIVFGYAVEQQLIESNPAVGIKRLDEAYRERLISAEEYSAIYAKAGERLQIIMDLLYLTGQRVNDVLQIRRDDLTDEGIYFRQRKTGAKVVVRWSADLRAAVDRAKALGGNLKAFTLLQGRRGKPVDYKTVHDQWVKACAAAGIQDADLRDLRAMSLTAAENEGKNATALAGHTSPAMTRRYLRSKHPKSVDGPSISRQFASRKKGTNNQ